MKKLFLILIMILLPILSAHGIDEHYEKTWRLYNLMDDFKQVTIYNYKVQKLCEKEIPKVISEIESSNKSIIDTLSPEQRKFVQQRIIIQSPQSCSVGFRATEGAQIDRDLASLSDQDIDYLINFYSSPIGKKFQAIQTNDKLNNPVDYEKNLLKEEQDQIKSFLDSMAYLKYSKVTENSLARLNVYLKGEVERAKFLIQDYKQTEEVHKTYTYKISNFIEQLVFFAITKISESRTSSNVLFFLMILSAISLLINSPKGLLVAIKNRLINFLYVSYGYFTIILMTNLIKLPFELSFIHDIILPPVCYFCFLQIQHTIVSVLNMIVIRKNYHTSNIDPMLFLGVKLGKFELISATLFLVPSVVFLMASHMNQIYGDKTTGGGMLIMCAIALAPFVPFLIIAVFLNIAKFFLDSVTIIRRSIIISRRDNTIKL